MKNNFKNPFLVSILFLLIIALLGLIGIPSWIETGLEKFTKDKRENIELDFRKISEYTGVNLCTEDEILKSKHNSKDLLRLINGYKLFGAKLREKYESTQFSDSSSNATKITDACLAPVAIKATKPIDSKINGFYCTDKAYIGFEGKAYSISDSIDNHIASLIKNKVVKHLSTRIKNLKRSNPQNSEIINLKILKFQVIKESAVLFNKYGHLISEYYQALCLDSTDPAPTPIPTGESNYKPCGNIAHGGTTNRTRFEKKSAENCKSENQIGTCNNGLISWSGNYAETSCTAISSESGDLKSPQFLQPKVAEVSAVNNKVTIEWENISTRYLIRANNTTTSERVLNKDDQYTNTYELDVIPGNSYDFWVHSTKDFTYSNPKSYSTDSHIVFAVKKDASSIVTPYKKGDRIKLTKKTNVRKSASLTGQLLGTQEAGSLGTILSGPTKVDNTIWWEVNFDSGVDGITGQDNYELYNPSTPNNCTNGQVQSRTMYNALKATATQSCLSENQTRTCNNNQWSSWSGSYIYSGCEIPEIDLCTTGRAKILTKNGVTWEFDREYQCGRYASGDYWVLGPVDIIKINPIPTDNGNGSMINPDIGSYHGFDNGASFSDSFYKANLNVGKGVSNSSPLKLPKNTSLVSSITLDAYNNYPVEMFSILTVVESVQPVGSFRPPALGSGSKNSLWKESDLDYSKLNSLPRSSLPSYPSLNEYVNYFKYPWFEKDVNWTGGYIRTPYMAHSDSPHYHGYGRDMAYRTGTATLLLNLDFTPAEKRDLLVGVVQAGIDNYGFISNGGVWYNDGGHNLGRLSPVIVAAGVLKDYRLKAIIKGEAQKFQEFQNTFRITSYDLTRQLGELQDCDNDPLRIKEALRSTNCDPIHPYTNNDLNRAEWGIRHASSPELDNNWWYASYRSINGSNFTAPTMTARVMGLRSTINWEPLFEYAEYHLAKEIVWGSDSNPTPGFHRAFYDAFKNSTPVVIN